MITTQMKDQLAAVRSRTRRHDSGSTEGRVQRVKQSLGPKAKKWSAKARTLVVEHPGPALGAALALGLAIGWWVKRRN
jgi:ElaB/YqjD/DUF883 family membrane-anchored ribosome-binding protein